MSSEYDETGGVRAATIIGILREWAEALAAEDDQFRCYVMGSVLRRDFVPGFSDVDIVVVVKSAERDSTASRIDALARLRPMTIGLERAFDAVRPRPLRLDLGAYFDREVAVRVHKSRDPEYFTSNRFQPLGDYPGDVFPPLASNAMYGVDVGSAIALSWVQEARHLYLRKHAPLAMRLVVWQKFFQQLRNVLRLAGVFSRTPPEPDRYQVLREAGEYYPGCFDVTGCEQTLDGRGPWPPSITFAYECYEGLASIVWDSLSSRAKEGCRHAKGKWAEPGRG